MAYLGALALVFHLRVLLSEEPRLRASFGEERVGYKQEVPRWMRQSLATRKEKAGRYSGFGKSAR